VSGNTLGDKREELLARTDTLAPEFRARAAEDQSHHASGPGDQGQAGRLVSAVASCVSRGGDPITIFEGIEKLCYTDGSAGWTTLIGCSLGLMTWLDPGVAAELLGGNPDICTTDMFAPLGRAVPCGNASFTVDGRWPCNSGCPHSEWFMARVIVMDGDHPRVVPPAPGLAVRLVPLRRRRNHR